MRDFNLKEKDISSTSENEIKAVDRHVKKPNENKSGPNRLQKLSTIMFIVLCVIVVMFTLRYFNHMSILNNYSVPKDALSDAANDDEDTPADEDVNYVDEVVYNPSDAGNALADAQNNYKVSLDFNDLNGEPIWFSGDSSASYSWKFMSGYDYKSAKVDCVWLCTSDEGHIVYAYHTATYNGVDNTFENATTHLTKEGGDSLAAD